MVSFDRQILELIQAGKLDKSFEMFNQLNDEEKDNILTLFDQTIENAVYQKLQQEEVECTQ